MISHPIQYFSPLFKEMAKCPCIDLNVYYCSDESIRGMKDVGFGINLKWFFICWQRKFGEGVLKN